VLLLPADDDSILAAASMLRRGGLVAFPTETVYGLGANALDAAAVRRVFAAKGRPVDNPLIVHVASPDGLDAVASAVSPLARDLADRFWPGPLTLVVDAAGHVPRDTTAGLSTVAVRMPDHHVALWLLRAAHLPVAAPSANRSGRPSPTTAQHVADDLGDAVDLILDGGPCPLGLESTVVDTRGPVPVVLREGAVTREQLGGGGRPDDTQLAASPGTRHRHYSPTCRVEIAPVGEGAALAAARAAGQGDVGLVARTPAPDGVEQVAVFADAADLGRVLYAALRAAEDAGLDLLVVEAVEETGVGRAVMDRLRRAAH
jgi:L-threonylcarbamoyladenylate synthase